MDLIAFKDFLAVTASICTMCQFLAGILVCRKFIINKSVKDSSCFPFITCFMSCGVWMIYGQMKGDRAVIIVNLLGAALQIMYTLVYLHFSKKKTGVTRQFLGAFFFVLMVYAYSVMEYDKQHATRVVGFLSCSLTILFFASPLIMLAHVVRVRSAESLPFPIIMLTLVSSCQWFAYGVILNDPFIQTPNFLGCLLSGFQLPLFVIFPTKKIDQASLI